MDRTQTQTYLNKFWNYNGSNQSDEIQAFLASNPGAASGVGRMSSALNKMTMGKPIAKLNNGGYIKGYDEGGLEMPKRPTEPKLVEQPTSIGNEPPRYAGGYNRTDNKTFEYGTAYQVGVGDANTDNPVTQRYPLSTPNRKSVIASAVAAWLKNANKPHEDWKVQNAKYLQDKAAYDKYVADKAQYDKDVVQYQKDADAYNEQVQKQTQERLLEMTAASSDLLKGALTDPEGTIKKPETKLIDVGDSTTTLLPSDIGQIPEFRVDPISGLGIVSQPGYTATKATTSQIAAADPIDANLYQATQTQADVGKAVQGVQAEQGEISAEALAQAATADPTKTAVGNMQAAQGTGIMMNNPVQREIQQGELVSGVADAQKAVAFTEQVQAAQATPSQKAMVQEQLSGLMQDFEGGATPAWAAGAMRAAMGKMAARGLGASSLAGQAVVQAAMESALPIAQADAQTVAQFEMQNLSNRQQRAMLSAQQRAQFIGQEFDQAFQSRVQNASRIADVANMNFTAEQQVALENSRIANTVNLQNLTNQQAMVMAEAAAVANLEAQNLSNEQQAAVQNANAFLQMDMTNLNNRQATNMFKAQSMVQSLFNDAAADNAAKQFNASSQNQTDQFMANLVFQTDQFNASALNATSQYNAGQDNAAKQYNAGLREQRKQFNATNRLVVAQANTLWRQNVATLNTAAENEDNRTYAKDVNALTNKNLDELWQRERDIMDMAFRAEDSRMTRVLSLLLADKDMEAVRKQLEFADEKAKTSFWMDLLWPFD